MNHQPSKPRTINPSRILILTLTGILFLGWLGFSFPRITGTQHGFLRFVLGLGFALLILFRRKRPEAWMRGERPRGGRLSFWALSGTCFQITGIIFRVHQFEWLGLIVLFYCALRWALPNRYAVDLRLALLFVYWVHPVPSQIFGPLQLFMQRLSIGGAEFVLHLANVRVWADGLVLRTGYQAFEVPASCSGMETATTVLLFSLGLGLLRRFRGYEIALLIVLGLAQALALNVLRVSLMIVLGVRSGVDPAFVARFVHDTLGFLLLGAVVLVVVEVHVYENWRKQRALRRLADTRPDIAGSAGVGPEGARDLVPPFWGVVFQWRWLILGWVLFSVFISAAAYKGRPHHRAVMVKDVAEGLSWQEEYDVAQAAADVAHEYAPDNVAVDFEGIRLLVQSGHHDEALARLDAIPAKDRLNAPFAYVLGAYAYMGLDRSAEALALLDSLPEFMASDPRVAIIAAEISSFADEPDRVVRHIVTAAGRPANIERVRRLHGYLAQRRRWDAIALSDRAVPYTLPEHALTVAEAHMNRLDYYATGRAVREGVEKWPADPRFLLPLYYLTVNHFEWEWEQRFAAQLLSTLEVQTVEQLYGQLENCFRLRRPDLAWLLYARIRRLDPEFPGLPLAVAKFGHLWFSFRKQHVGLRAASPVAFVDLQPIVRLTRTRAPFVAFWQAVPLVDKLAVTDTDAIRIEYLHGALARFEVLDRQEALSVDMRKEFVSALRMAEQWERARNQLDRLERDHPARAGEFRELRARLYNRERNWAALYEVLREDVNQPQPAMRSLFLLCTAAQNLQLKVFALEYARKAERLFPASIAAATFLAEALDAVGEAEQALFVLGRTEATRTFDSNVLELRFLMKTERFLEAKQVCAGLAIPSRAVQTRRRQRLLLPPAEDALRWHRLGVPSAIEFETYAALVQRRASGMKSPFLQALDGRWLAAYRSRCVSGTIGVEDWAAIGRDPLEKAYALYQLAMLCLNVDKRREAESALRLAVTTYSGSPILWRVLIGLVDGDARVLARAQAECSDDPDIWLAALVRAVKAGAHEAALTAELRQAVESARYSPATFTRAAEFLLRNEGVQAACVAARHADAQARGLVPAHIVAARCALRLRDSDWAERALRRAIENSNEPPDLLYRELVRLGGVNKNTEFVRALLELRNGEPENTRWSELLGFARFLRGGGETIDALYELSAAIEAGSTNRWVYIVAAEAARQIGSAPRAVQILEQARARYPEDWTVLNNLAHTLALLPERVQEAEAMVPELLALRPHDPLVMDTAAVVWIRAGKLDDAERLLRTSLDHLPDPSAGRCRAEYHLAELALRRDDLREARRALVEVLDNPECPQDISMPGGRLLNTIELKLLEREMEGETREEGLK